MSGSQWSSGNAADQKSRMVAAGFVLIFLLSLIPILAVARYDCASGDDYGFGAAAHQAFVRTGSVAAAVQADVHHVGEVYEIWQGTWLSCFLFGLHPEVFHYHAYVIVPWIMLLVLSAGVLIFVHHFLTVRFGFSGSLSLTAAMILLISMVQLVPDRRFAYFWWNGSIHYTVPFSLALLSLVCADQWLRTQRRRSLVFLCILAAALGGMSYPAALLAPVLIFLFTAADLIRKHNSGKRAAFFLIPAALEGIGLWISAKAPGNRVRGGAGFGFHIGRMLRTIGECFVYAVQTAIRFIRQSPLLLLAVVLFAWILLLETKRLREQGVTIHISRAELVQIFGFGFLGYVVVFAPELYAGVSVSEGVGNTYFLCFLLMIFTDVLAATIYASSHHASSGRRKHAWRYAVMPILLCCCALVFRRNLKTTADYQCLTFIRTGNADRFHREMELQNQLLTESDDLDVILPMTNGYDGPIMHMPVVEDSTAWTNRKTAEFYGKRTITGMKREEWISLYGERYGVTQ